ncbi:MAG: pyruvoyl-dependent arginine decarboxylase [Haloferacaceae archaeon]
MTRSDIVVVAGVGEGVTELGAFDDALAAAGLHNYNLVTLSSVLPPGASVVVRERFPEERGLTVGDPVAVVLAHGSAGEGRETVAAGLGWATAAEGGVFFEATGATESECRAKVEAELEGARGRRDWDWQDGGVHTAAHGADGPAAAVVAAVYGRLELHDLAPSSPDG